MAVSQEEINKHMTTVHTYIHGITVTKEEAMKSWNVICMHMRNVHGFPLHYYSLKVGKEKLDYRCKICGMTAADGNHVREE